ncbi:Uncharacterised protein [Achromobacter sp. 2789STDY5608615]|uniref:hypothetical protein n=1 Tax=Achromobacter sp. 2789STDY5608615 TaxID=1806492 RepID=UPI0006BF1F3D|nr:hypothetical protein [Achromobacter sp. 2789STDY5608615]CUK16460.1 Uncharacterised protein [Achromobacter sp. 2789STDY5608615]
MSSGYEINSTEGSDGRENELTSKLERRFADVESSYLQFRNILSAVEAKVDEIQSAASSVLAIKTQVVDEQVVIATKSTHIQNAQEHADSVRAELDRIQTSATQQATEVEGQRQRALSAADTAAAVALDVQQRAAELSAAVDAALASRDDAIAASATAKLLAEKADNTERIIAAYEKKLSELEVKSAAQLELITSLLPGATAAGLAHAFDDRRKTFLKPGERWQMIFVGSIVLLVLLALSGLWNIYNTGNSLTWGELGRLWLARLPIAAALIWLAMHASREAALAKRLEEDYGYKAAIAASFQGFQKQMADIVNSAAENSPLAKLCGDTLATIANPPGRIYERHQLIVTPGDELLSAAANTVGLERAKV